MEPLAVIDGRMTEVRDKAARKRHSAPTHALHATTCMTCPSIRLPTIGSNTFIRKLTNQTAQIEIGLDGLARGEKMARRGRCR
jgi:hypothetical protein